MLTLRRACGIFGAVRFQPQYPLEGDYPVDITTEKEGGVIFVALQAESLDASNTNEFKRTVATAVEPKAKVVLDLAQVQFIDSSGCGAILAFLRQLTTVGGDLKLCNVTKPVRSLFELVRMHRILDIYNNREEAAKSYQAG
jgi:anti-sigma B factor antagonist